MVNISKLTADMRSGRPIEEVLKEHNLDFKSAMALLRKANDPRKKLKKNRYKSTGEKYISKYGNVFMVRRTLNGKLQYFGSYETLEDAIKIRDYLEVHGWYKHRLDTAKRNCGIKED